MNPDPWYLVALSVGIFVVTVMFVAVYLTEPFWRTTVGRALMAFAVATGAFQGLALARYFLGDDYAGRDQILGGARCVVLLSVSALLFALYRERRRNP